MAGTIYSRPDISIDGVPDGSSRSDMWLMEGLRLGTPLKPRRDARMRRVLAHLRDH